MTDQQRVAEPETALERLSELEAQATPGPWVACPHVAGTDPQCPCKYRGDVVSEATGETLFQMGVGPDKIPDTWEDQADAWADAWKGIKTTTLEQGYVNGRYLTALANAAPDLLGAARREAGLRTAAQALVDVWPTTERPLWAQRLARALDDLRAALTDSRP